MISYNIYDLLPHRAPFLFVDKIVRYIPEEKKLISTKNFTFNENFFAGHFPGAPVVPGVLLLEGLAQTAALHYACEAGILVGARFEQERDFKNLFLLSDIKNVKFKQSVLPGDRVLYEVVQIRKRSNFSWYQGVIKRDESSNQAIVCVAELTAYFRVSSPFPNGQESAKISES